MGNTLYLECRSGISGDMTVAALLDLGADQEVLMKALRSLPVQGFRVEISRVVKAGLDVCDFNVILDQAHENHDHDMEYLHGHSHGGEDSEHGHHHEKAHEHEHRGMPEIRRPSFWPAGGTPIYTACSPSRTGPGWCTMCSC